MVSLGELIVVISFIWLLLVVIANRVNLQKYNIFVSSGFLLYVPSIFNRILKKLAKKVKVWEHLGKYAQLPTFVLFLSIPLLLSVNLIQGIFFDISPIFLFSVIENLRVETFLLIFPVLAIFLSFQMFISAIYDIIDGRELKRSGLLLIGVVLTFFAQTSGSSERPRRIKAIAVIVLLQLLLVGLAFPASRGTQNAMSNMYEESDGAIITVIYPNSPAASSNLQINMILTQLQLTEDNIITFRRNITSAAVLDRLLMQIPAGTEITLVTNDSQRLSITGSRPPEDFHQQEGSYLGVALEDYRPPKNRFLPLLLPFWVEIFFDWFINIGLLFGLYNLLPLPRSSGFTLMREFITQFNLDISSLGQKVISYMSLAILAGNVLYFVL